MKTQIEIADLCTPLDIVVFLFILGVTLGAVVLGQRKKKAQFRIVEYLLMGRSLTLPLFVSTLVATWYGGIFGVTQLSFETGIYNFLTQGVFWYCTYLIFAFFLVKKVRSQKPLTLPEMVGGMFGPRSRKLSAIFNFFNVVPIAYAMSLGIFLKAFLGWDLWICTSLGVALVLAYSCWGGLRSVVISDIIQFWVMCLAVFFVAVISWKTYGGIFFLRENLPATHFEITGGHSWGTTLVWGLIALSTLVDPNFYQRCFAASTDKVAKRGILICTGIWIAFDLCTTLGGMYARAVLPEASSGEAYLIYALQLLPEGLRGFFLGGILATILSTLDSYLFLAGTTFSYDLMGKREGGFWHRGSVLGVGVLATFLSLFFDGNIRMVWKTLGSYSAACLLFPVLFGMFFPGKVSDRRFVFSALLGGVGVTYWRFAEHSGFAKEIDEIYIGIFLTALSLLFPRRIVFRGGT